MTHLLKTSGLLTAMAAGESALFSRHRRRWTIMTGELYFCGDASRVQHYF